MSDDAVSTGASEESAEESVRHEEVIHAEGHEHVAGTHASTFEVTTDDYLTPAGDCIVGIEADRAPSAFADAFVAACQRAEARIVTTLSITDGGSADVDPETVPEQRIVARGDADLSLEDDRSAVWRTSDYVDDRTVAVGADHAAEDLDRSFVDALADGARLEVRIVVEVPA
ncbi:DUF371 domain-containing protein [Salinarchaeum chitinilyticum]